MVRPVVRRFDIEVGHCSQCQRRVQGRHVLQTSDALGAAGAQLGPGVVALVVELHTEMGVPLAKVAHLLRTTFGLQVTPGGLAHVLHRAARAAAPAYTELCEQVRNAPVVTPDETGWRVGGVRHWLWTFVTPDTTVYAICPGRGFDDAATVLGTDYVGVLVRDGWAPYRCYDGLHQTCLNHLLQRCKQLREDYPDSPWAGEVQAVLRAGLDLRDRCNAGALSEHGMATARGRLTARLARLVDAPPPLDDAERFAAHLATEFPAVFLFLWDPSLDATNWRAEQAIRPAVVIRKVCGGNRNRTRHGATPSRSWPASCAPPASVTSTCLRWSPRCYAPPNPSSPSSSAFRRRPRRRATSEPRLRSATGPRRRCARCTCLRFPTAASQRWKQARVNTRSAQATSLVAPKPPRFKPTFGPCLLANHSVNEYTSTRAAAAATRWRSARGRFLPTRKRGERASVRRRSACSRSRCSTSSGSDIFPWWQRTTACSSCSTSMSGPAS